ncbi:MAG: hypothetical protein A2287_05960 [Candidatus Melainabacteria bacterium RIFOXYA12_FULL_32_12]|nr:MAG: hypothetical protein A2287_05960 [Candidatus Melainabacteria bacterium RIFOXYA12_FULL_32_12]
MSDIKSLFAVDKKIDNIKQKNNKKAASSSVKKSQISPVKWGTVWILSLKQLYSERGIAFSRIYSIPAVKELKITDNEVIAQVKDANSQFYKLKINLEKADEIVRAQIKNFICSNPSVALEVGFGHLPESFMDFIDDLGIFPQNLDEIKISCSCRREFNCSHVESVYAVLEREINKNPFIIFNLRGISAVELMEVASAVNGLETKVKKDINSKFVPIGEYIYNEENFACKEDFSFPATDLNSLFSLLPANPIFFERRDFKSKLLDIYETVQSELDSILVKGKLPPIRNTEFYLYYTNDNVLKAFITPANNFLYYLKSKGSLFRYSIQKLTVPVIDKNEQKIILQEKEGISLLAETVFEYFLYYSLSESNDEISPSSIFLNQTASLAVALVKSLSFVPEVIMHDNGDFTVRYVPLGDIEEILNSHKSRMPANLAFKDKGCKILAQDGSYDILSIFITYIIHKLTFLKSSKLKSCSITNIFTKPQPLSAISPKGKNIAASISYWLDVLSIRNKNISPIIRVESCENQDNNFTIHIDIINHKTTDIIDLSKLFENKEEIFSMSSQQIRSEISGQILVASNYMPVLREILDSKGLMSPSIDLKEILDLISRTSIVLSALGIKIVLPKGLRNLLSPRVVLKAMTKDSKNIDISTFFEEDNSSHLSLKNLLDFSYEIAIGEEKLSKEEFLELVKSAEGIVKYKDQYIMLNPQEIKLILKKIDNTAPEISSPMELLHSALSGFYNDIGFDIDDTFKRLINDFIKIDEITIPIGLKGTLRPYQERGFKWLYSNTMRGFGSCIADDMGLGKTIQVISLILKLKEDDKLNKPALVICPTTLVGNWYKECARFAPSLKVHIYHGTERILDFDSADVIITTYGLLRNEIGSFEDKNWDIVIIDEAQNIKNPAAAQTIAVKSVKTKTYIAMTGTPVENRLSELWSIFDFINKGYLGNITSFQRNYAIPIEKHRDVEKIEKLRLATSPFALRRLKNDKSIITDLPEKIVFDEYCYLTKEQAALYEKVLETSFKSIETKTGIQRRGQIFKLITSLKQICNHPTQFTKIDRLSKDLSGKTEKAFSIIEQVFEQNEKAIIFTQYKEMGDLLINMLKDEFNMNIPFFHGSVSRTQRDKMVEEFQFNDDIKLMVISLKAGGLGLNLTSATNVIHYDLWWNPAVEDQATDRTYRIGQTQNVIIHRLITLGTFEEKIDEMIKSKRELANLTVSTGEKLITELSNQELKEIFSLSRI